MRQLVKLTATLVLTCNCTSVKLRTRCAQEYQFRNIAKAEWANLLAFLKEKPMRIVNFDEAAQGPGGGRGIMDFAADDIDAGAAPGTQPLGRSHVRS